MQDRFKFRVWNNKKRKYEDAEKDTLDYFICCFPGVVYESHCCVFDDLTEAEEGHYTLEQCTGLKDKNGKLIYENDYVKIKDTVYKVFWNKTKISLANILKKDTIDIDITQNMEIIGNEHETRDFEKI